MRSVDILRFVFIILVIFQTINFIFVDCKLVQSSYFIVFLRAVS
jgi:hypothetical protein